jgi:phosphatidate phosphatase APP1
MKPRRAVRVVAAAVLLSLSMAVSLGVGAAQAAAVTISIDPNSGPPGTSVDVHGLHWLSNAQVDVYFVQDGRAKFLASTTTNTNGYFQVTVTIPAAAQAGAAAIRVQQPDSLIRRQPTFTVT